MIQKYSFMDFDDPKVFFEKLGKQQFKYQIFKTNTDLTNQKKGHLVLVSRSQRKLFVCGVKVNKA